MTVRGTPSVRLVEGPGLALRVAGLLVWLDRPEGADPEGLIRGLVVAAQGTPGQVPIDHLVGLLEEWPELSLAAVVIGTEFGRAWVCGRARVVLAGVSERVLAPAGPEPESSYFPLPRSGFRLGTDPAPAPATWTHLIEGAVPAAGIDVVWDPAPGSLAGSASGSASGSLAGSPAGSASGAAGAFGRSAADSGAGGAADPAAPGFEAVVLVNAPRPPAAKPLPTGSGARRAGGVTVAGLRCSQGHFNHPLAAHCAWCGIGMAQVSHVLVREPRPAVGVLIVDAQGTFTLDADYVLGREPRVREEVDGVGVREIVLGPDRSISRAHAAVRLRDWAVLVEDLGSALGTWVQQPGQGPFCIPSGQPVELAPGGVFFVGPHRLTFHSHFLG